MVGFVNSEFWRGFGDHQLPAVAGRGQAVRSDSVEGLFGYAHLVLKYHFCILNNRKGLMAKKILNTHRAFFQNSRIKNLTAQDFRKFDRRHKVMKISP